MLWCSQCNTWKSERENSFTKVNFWFCALSWTGWKWAKPQGRDAGPGFAVSIHASMPSTEKYQGLVKWCILSDQLHGFAVTHLLQVPEIHQLSSTQASHYNGEISSDLPDLSDFPLSASPLFIAECWTLCALSCPLPKALFSWCRVSCKVWPWLQPQLFYFASFVAEAFPALKMHLYYHG